MQEIKSVGVMSAAIVSGMMCTLLGLLVIPFYFLARVDSFVGVRDASIGSVMIVVFAVLIPLVYGGIGFVGGALLAWVYNAVANRFGGLKIELRAVYVISSSGPR